MPTSPWSLSRAEVRELDRLAIQEYGIPGMVLMENAGRGVAELLLQLNPDRQPVTILCGPGNNGGDGYVIARHLDAENYPLEVWNLGTPKTGTDAATNYNIWQSCGESHTNPDPTALRSLSGWVVDAMFGTGLDRPLIEPFATIVAAINAAPAIVLAVDIPSGQDCDTGEPLGVAVQAAHTATFVAWKQGFLKESASRFTGKLHRIDIGVPRRLLERFHHEPRKG